MNNTLKTSRRSISLVAVAAIMAGVALAQSTVTLVQLVNKATPSVVATSSLNPSVYEQTVTLTATLSAAHATNATGTVQWLDGATPLGSPVTVSSGTSTLSVASLEAGAHSLTAVYSGDSNFATATSPVLSQVVNKAVPGVGGIAPVTLVSSLNPSVYQNSVTYTATVPVGATGSIQFMDDSVALGSTTISGTTASYSIATLLAGTHPITSVYSGDLNFTGATSGVVSQLVNKAPTVESVFATPPTAATVGSSVTFTTLVNTGMLTPTGTVSFTDGATVIGSGTVSPMTSTNLLSYSSDFTQWKNDSSGAVDPAIGAATGGPDGALTSATTITYPETTGSGIFSGQKLTSIGSFAGLPMVASFWAQSASSMTIVVDLADGTAASPQTGSVTTSPTWKRYVVPFTLPADAGANAIISIRSANGPAGTVAYFGAQLEQAANAGVYVMTAGGSLSGVGGVATLTTTTLLAGDHPIVGTYSGDSNYLGNAGGMGSSLAVGQGTAAATVVSSLSPTTYGQSVSFTAHVTGPNATPTGSVSFYDGATVIGSGVLDGAGSASASISSLIVGDHTITVRYAGDKNFNAVTSAAITQTVTSSNATVIATSSASPSLFGQSVVFSVAVSGSGSTPTGTVTVTDGSTTLGVITLDALGAGSLSTDSLTAGSHSLLFTYSGDSNYTH